MNLKTLIDLLLRTQYALDNHNVREAHELLNFLDNEKLAVSAVRFGLTH